MEKIALTDRLSHQAVRQESFTGWMPYQYDVETMKTKNQFDGLQKKIMRMILQ
jgi:hypothetical protein